ncbi:hypothetical protein LPB137_10390 [Poseidonibacter parvus]|uniref:Uncharacterized protein n=1 Tax=Poseidonibacter parvus TaxID=1850254 RepID=A0A1P8KNY3_9BACT|nr:hypothetical protein [Poseidonibacter parvus]APW66223.1 hypothetical protein LPB137_10390 [Poseidonibacter parvus]
MSNRVTFIRKFFIFIRNLDYAVLKYTENNLNELSFTSDIDIAIKKSNLPNILKFLQSTDIIEKYHIFKNSFMYTITFYFKDRSFLSLDLIYKFIRKDLEYIKLNKLLESKETNHENISIPNIEYQFLYIYFFYIINKSNIGDKYKSYLSNLNTYQKNKILGFMKTNYDIEFTNIEDSFFYNQYIHAKIITKLNIENNLTDRLLNNSNYFFDLFKNRKKSTFINLFAKNDLPTIKEIEKFKEVLINKYRLNVLTINTNENIGVNKLLVILYHLFKGYTLIIIDSQKEKISLPKSIIKVISNLSFKINLENSLKDKQELYKLCEQTYLSKIKGHK